MRLRLALLTDGVTESAGLRTKRRAATDEGLHLRSLCQLEVLSAHVKELAQMHMHAGPTGCKTSIRYFDLLLTLSVAAEFRWPPRGRPSSAGSASPSGWTTSRASLAASPPWCWTRQPANGSRRSLRRLPRPLRQ